MGFIRGVRTFTGMLCLALAVTILGTSITDRELFGIGGFSIAAWLLLRRL